MSDSVLPSRRSSVGAKVRANQRSARERKQALVSRFLAYGLLGITLISICLSAGGYLRLKANELSAAKERVQSQLETIAKSLSSTPNVSHQAAVEALGALSINRVVNVDGLKLFSSNGKQLWKGGNHQMIAQALVDKGLKASGPSTTIAPEFFTGSAWLSLLTGNYDPSVFAINLPIKEQRTTALISINNQEAMRTQRSVSMRLMLFLLLSTSLLFALLYVTFLRGIRTIDDQQHRLNKQIAGLSNLLKENKNMQRSIRTASARAVELNEQFLRRVGADLHDGPAQMIGFSIMRLNQVLEKDESGLLGPEFHAVKQALEESLEEIRGISSGLVLPELESMSIEQCMRKVVLLHTSTHETKVEEFYQDIDVEIPLPIKISAYRFVQEGLNNAHKHGQAEKCRLTVSVTKNVLHISLKDNGSGFRKSKLGSDGKHLGLIGLTDRIESLGGKLSINSELGVGTSLRLSVSLDEI